MNKIDLEKHLPPGFILVLDVEFTGKSGLTMRLSERHNTVYLMMKQGEGLWKFLRPASPEDVVECYNTVKRQRT